MATTRLDVITLSLVLGALTAVCTAPDAAAQSKVEVVNRPDVVVPNPIPHSRLRSFEGIPVSVGSRGPAPPLSLDTAGFSHVSLSLAVETQGSPDRGGMVTATLIPAEDFVLTMWQAHGIELFAIQAGVTVKGPNRRSVFGAQPVVFPLAFPSYVVLFHNASDRPVKAYLYVYMTN